MAWSATRRGAGPVGVGRASSDTSHAGAACSARGRAKALSRQGQQTGTGGAPTSSKARPFCCAKVWKKSASTMSQSTSPSSKKEGGMRADDCSRSSTCAATRSAASRVRGVASSRPRVMERESLGSRGTLGPGSAGCVGASTSAGAPSLCGCAASAASAAASTASSLIVALAGSLSLLSPLGLGLGLRAEPLARPLPSPRALVAAGAPVFLPEGGIATRDVGLGPSRLAKRGPLYASETLLGSTLSFGAVPQTANARAEVWHRL